MQWYLKSGEEISVWFFTLVCVCVCMRSVYYSDHVFCAVQMFMYWFFWVCRFLCQPFPPNMCMGNIFYFCVRTKINLKKKEALNWSLDSWGGLNWFRQQEKSSWIEREDLAAWPIYHTRSFQAKPFGFICKTMCESSESANKRLRIEAQRN